VQSVPSDVLVQVRSAPTPVWACPDDARAWAEAGVLEAPISGTVYGVALNTRAERAALAEAFAKPPYKAPPQAPVLFVKPPNTFARHGADVVVPAGVEALEARAALAVWIGRPACRVSAAEALDFVDGYALALDFQTPGADYYRPAVRQSCRDGFLPIGPWITPASAIAHPNALEIVAEVDGVMRQRLSMAELHRPLADLLAEITDFMTLSRGDVLLAALTPAPLVVAPGRRVTASAEGLGALTCHVVAEGARS
jgi:5-oxopent-3-ene-1,2,5-tricarboxylate decarboxylase / 2-hydroxyhepta-2,4-diene-1,7-dioate isomerase